MLDSTSFGTHPKLGHPTCLLAAKLTLAQKILGLVGVEVLGFNQHHQETIGSWEVADGQKDLPGPCGCLLKTGG